MVRLSTSLLLSASLCAGLFAAGSIAAADVEAGYANALSSEHSKLATAHQKTERANESLKIERLLTRFEKGDMRAEEQLVAIYSGDSARTDASDQFQHKVLRAFEKTLQRRAFEWPSTALSMNDKLASDSKIKMACASGMFAAADCANYQKAYSPTICFQPIQEAKPRDFILTNLKVPDPIDQ